MNIEEIEKLEPLDYIAQMIADRAAKEEGYTCGSCRWGVLRKDLQSKYKAEAKKLFDDWKNEEVETAKSRGGSIDDIIKNAKARKA